MSAELSDARAALFPAKQDRIPVRGQPIRHRFIQAVAWSVVAAAFGAALIAGGYFLILEVHWRLFIDGVIHWGPYTLKNWWDHLVNAASWPLYRHGLRDLGEPALATVFVKTLLAKPSQWQMRVGRWRLIATPFLLIAVAVILITGGIWLLDFGLPQAWHGLFGGYHVPHTWILGKITAAELVLGVAVGLVLHRIWAPAGATIQGFVVDRAADRKLAQGGADPIWVRYPLAPPMVRERYAWLLTHNDRIDVRKPIPRWAVIVTVLVAVGVIAVGFIAHYYIGAGNTFPYLAS